MKYIFQDPEQISFRVIRNDLISHGFWPFPQANSTSLIINNLATQKALTLFIISFHSVWVGCWSLCDYDEDDSRSQTKESTDKILYIISVGLWTISTTHLKLRMLKSELRLRRGHSHHARSLLLEGKLTREQYELALDTTPRGRIWRQFQLCPDSGEKLS